MTIPDFPQAASSTSPEKVNVSSRSFIALWLFSLLLGFFGADHFYLGKTKTALIKLFTFGGFGFWWLADIVLTVAGKQKDDSGIYVTPQKNEQIAAGVISGVVILGLWISGGTSTESENSAAVEPTPTATKTETFRMPEVVGLLGAEAVDELAKFGFELDEIKFVSNDEEGTIDVSMFEVCSQIPGPGAITSSSTVELEVEKACVVVVEPSESPSSEVTSASPTKEQVVEYVKVADVVGLDYQTAQDIWRAQGLIVLPATDATGQNRWAFIDANWVVVGQDLKPGTKVEVGTGITASIKKFGE